MRAFAAAIALLLSAAAPHAALADAAAAQPRTLSVTGSGEAKGVPDRAQLSTGVVVHARSAAEALTANARAMNQVFDTLKRAGIPEKNIQTSNFSVSPQFSEPKPGSNTPPRIVGYEVSNTVSVTVDGTDKLGGAIDALVAAGANQIDGPSFSFADPKLLLAKARADAVRDATERAQAYASAAGVTLGPILSINEGASYSPVAYRTRGLAAMSETAPTPIAAGEGSVSANVSITWEIR